MEPADPRKAETLAEVCGRGSMERPNGESTVEPETRAVEMVVVEERAGNRRRYDDDVFEKPLPDGGDEALGDAVLVRTAVTGPGGLDVHGPDQRDDLGAEGRVAVEDQVPGRGL